MAEKPKEKKMNYNDSTPIQRAEIGRYAAENGATRATKHFSHFAEYEINDNGDGVALYGCTLWLLMEMKRVLRYHTVLYGLV